MGTEGPAAAHGEAVTKEFTHQAQAFAAAPVMHAQETLRDFLDQLPTAASQRWVDVAAGPGIVTRALAQRVREAVGVDLTAAMVAKAVDDSAAAGVTNARFLRGDATALPFPAGAFDGALTRFSLHHIPHPLRVVREMARVVRPGGCVAVADHLTAPGVEAAAWHYEIERLRDPSHWFSLSADTVAALGKRAGLIEVRRRIVPFHLDWEEWLTRGSTGRANAAVIAALLAAAPPGAADVFRVEAGRLHLSLGVFVWMRPVAKEGFA